MFPTIALQPFRLVKKLKERLILDNMERDDKPANAERTVLSSLLDRHTETRFGNLDSGGGIPTMCVANVSLPLAGIALLPLNPDSSPMAQWDILK
jgi:hypothetical protein